MGEMTSTMAVSLSDDHWEIRDPIIALLKKHSQQLESPSDAQELNIAHMLPQDNSPDVSVLTNSYATTPAVRFKRESSLQLEAIYKKGNFSPTDKSRHG